MTDTQAPHWTPDATMTLKDGRTLAWDEFGDPDGYPVFMMHGTPSSRVASRTTDGPARDAGVRLIATDRPGVGASSFQPDRRIVDWASDIKELADHLGLEKYAVMSVSGGGPYALACATGGDPRLERAVVVSGVGPLETPEQIAGLYDTNRPIFELAATSPSAAAPALQGMSQVMVPGELSPAAVQGLEPPDQKLVEKDPAIYIAISDGMLAAMEPGIDGISYDLWLHTQPWGFELSDVEGPVAFMSGDADHNVPIQQVRDQHTAVPQSTLTVWEGAGHLEGFARMPELMAAAKGETLAKG